MRVEDKPGSPKDLAAEIDRYKEKVRKFATDTGILEIDPKAVEKALSIEDALVGYDAYVWYIYNTEHMDGELIPLSNGVPAVWTSERTCESFLLTESAGSFNKRPVFICLRGLHMSLQMDIDKEQLTEIKHILARYKGDHTPAGIYAITLNHYIVRMLGKGKLPKIAYWLFVLSILFAVVVSVMGMYMAFNPVTPAPMGNSTIGVV